MDTEPGRVQGARKSRVQVEIRDDKPLIEVINLTHDSSSESESEDVKPVVKAKADAVDAVCRHCRHCRNARCVVPIAKM